MDIKIASSWDEVTLEQFDKIQQIKNIDEFTTADILSVLTNIEAEELLLLDVADYSALVDKIKFLNEHPRKCIPESKIKIGDITFNVTLSALKMTAGQFLDFKSLISADNIDKRLARLMLCFMIPEGHKYNDGYDTEEMLDVIYKNMTVVEVTAYSNFFTLQLKAYADATLEYSVKQIKKDKKLTMEQKKFLIARIKEVKDIIKNGGCLA